MTFARHVPADFAHLDEHPLLAVPFALTLGGMRLRGERLSMTHLVATAEAEGGVPEPGAGGIARLQVEFPGFSVTLAPEVLVRAAEPGGAVLLAFADPTGPHLPQLRYLLNAVIAGEVAGVDGLLRYSGPAGAPKPKAAASPRADLRARIRSLASIALSAALIVAAAGVLTHRATTATELHPVFVETGGMGMRATAPGQLSYLAPDAAEGEVVFAIASNAGDVLNFAMPCDCEVRVAPGLREGATLLPTDTVLTLLDAEPELGARTMMSVEGFARVLNGDHATLRLADGRSFRVEVAAGEAATAAAMRGEMFVPVSLVLPDGALSEADAGLAGRLLITTPLLGGLLPEFGT
ncbi:hypothetical protein [Jannaschia sp. W003]|uniref:hypothetical protein n=1 Tax=Jannaschia sp. W003 TaxID=2867012 RepID=UPI0021A2E771|nr:hypothetical protein [Jannaschia sp. W003]UWQ22100.1 hypothetical protein K3554_03445 [Jannaschia sp. W003]